MSDLVGGFWLFDPEQTRAALIATTFQAMELQPGAFEVQISEKDGSPHFASEGYLLRKEETPELSLVSLAQSDAGVVEAEEPDQHKIFWFEPSTGLYPTITVWIPNLVTLYDEWPVHSEALISRWSGLCEQGKVVLGYFSLFEHIFGRRKKMSRYAHFACLNCKVTLFLGKIVFHPDETINFFHRGAMQIPNSQRLELNRVVWKMLADHASHPLRVLVEGEPEYDIFMDDEQVIKIGGDEPRHDISFEEYLKDWDG